MIELREGKKKKNKNLLPSWCSNRQPFHNTRSGSPSHPEGAGGRCGPPAHAHRRVIFCRQGAVGGKYANFPLNVNSCHTNQPYKPGKKIKRPCLGDVWGDALWTDIQSTTFQIFRGKRRGYIRLEPEAFKKIYCVMTFHLVLSKHLSADNKSVALRGEFISGMMHSSLLHRHLLRHHFS